MSINSPAIAAKESLIIGPVVIPPVVYTVAGIALVAWIAYRGLLKNN